MKSRFLLSIALLACGSAALGSVPVATDAGAPVSCLRIIDIDRTVVRDDQTVDFITRDRKVYRNKLPTACSDLGFEQAFSYETSLSKLCDVDIITVFNRTGPLRRGASCGLGTFQPVTLAK